MAIEQEDPVNAYFRQLREQQAAQQALQEAQQQPPPSGPTGMGDIRGQITGGARSADGTTWNFYDQGGNTLTSMPLQDYYSKYGKEGASLGQLGMQQNGVPVWNPAAGTPNDPYRGATPYDPNSTYQSPMNSVSNPNGNNWLGSGQKIDPRAMGTPAGEAGQPGYVWKNRPQEYAALQEQIKQMQQQPAPQTGMLNQQPFQWNGAPATQTAPKPAATLNPYMNNFFTSYWGK